MNMMTEPTPATIQRHTVDGFTIWWTDEYDCLMHKRFIDYTVAEALLILSQDFDVEFYLAGEMK